jgi:hypothetical protein
MSTAKQTGCVVGPDVDLDREAVADQHGQRITKLRVRELAEDALRPVRAGRPSLTSPGRRSPEVKARVPEDLRAPAHRGGHAARHHHL